LAETKPTRVFGIVVRPDSSDPGIAGSTPVPIDANHTEICKPTDRSSEVYLQVREFIRRRVEPPTGMGETQLDTPTMRNIPLTVNITNNITISGNAELMARLLREMMK
jgi:hypothetical protein